MIVIIGGLFPTHRIMFVLCFRGISTMLCLKPSTILDGMGS